MLRTLSRSEIAESRTRRVSVLMLIVLSVLLLAACENGWIRAKGERGALTYYQNKYGVEVDMVSVKTWGDTTAILPTKINQMVFRMSDGSTVLWDREAEQYADTHQAEEILTGLREQLVRPSTEEVLGKDILLSEYTVTSSVFQDYTKAQGDAVFGTYYDGDIRAFAKAERPLLMEYNVVMREAVSEEQGKGFRAQAERLRRKLHPFFSGDEGRIYVLSRNYTGKLIPYRQIRQPEGNRMVRGIGRLDLAEAVHWIENIYIEVMRGVWMTSDEEDFVLKPGDLVMEQIGTGAGLQTLLDERYEALPEVAEENKDGGYHVPDKQHCSKTVVKDEKAPIYRISWSDRARAAQDQYGRLDVCVYLEPEMAEAGRDFWYFSESDKEEFEMHRVLPGATEPFAWSGGNLTEGALYYFGEVEHGE